MGQKTRMQDWDAVKNSPETKDTKVEMPSAQEGRRVIRARQRAIGRELHRFFEGVAKEPIPEEFLELLRQIDHEAEASLSSKQGS